MSEARGGRGSTAAERVSGLLAGITRVATPLIRFIRPDLGRQLDERALAAEALRAWGRARPSGTVVWLHGASAGELLGAAPAVDRLRAKRDLLLVVTHFSPSGRAALDFLRPDYAGFPPLETSGDLARALEAVRPSVLVFAKLDVWPGLVAAARRAGVPLVLVNGVVRPGSGRLRGAFRRSLAGTYRSLDLVGAASDEDAERLRLLGVRDGALEVTGDAAFDMALDRADRARADGWTAEREARLPPRPAGGARLVAGSTWPADEEALLGALDGLGPAPDGRVRWQVVIAPHRPDEAHVRRLTGRCRGRGHPVARWSRLDASLPPHGIVVVDEVGWLAELYTAADVAYVGGGLAGGGLHNVLEPAAAGVPVIFGARHDRREARELVEAGGATEAGPGEIAGVLAELLAADRREAAGTRARAYVESRRGAGERSAALIQRALARNS